MFKKIRGWWYARQRRIDVEVLWPSICAQAYDRYDAQAAFTLHALKDPAWQYLGPFDTIMYIQHKLPHIPIGGKEL